MKTIDFRCGSCQTVFPIQIETYQQKMYDSFSGAYLNVRCPSCRTQFLHTAQLFQLLGLSSEELGGWNFGTNFVLPKK